jgi:hypothetical protein
MRQNWRLQLRSDFLTEILDPMAGIGVIYVTTRETCSWAFFGNFGKRLQTSDYNKQRYINFTVELGEEGCGLETVRLQRPFCG